MIQCPTYDERIVIFRRISRLHCSQFDLILHRTSSKTLSTKYIKDLDSILIHEISRKKSYIFGGLYSILKKANISKEQSISKFDLSKNQATMSMFSLFISLIDKE